MNEYDEYRVRPTPDAADVVAFRAYVTDELTLREISELEQRLNVRRENWGQASEMAALLWIAAKRAGVLEQLIPPAERAELDEDALPGITEALSWDAVGNLTPLQVSVVRAGHPEDEDGDAVPPESARE